MSLTDVVVEIDQLEEQRTAAESVRQWRSTPVHVAWRVLAHECTGGVCDVVPEIGWIASKYDPLHREGEFHSRGSIHVSPRLLSNAMSESFK